MKIAIIGTVGIGKTTIINQLIETNSKLKINYHKEEEKYTYLESAYSDMPKWAYIMQYDFMMLRLRTLFETKSSNDIEIFDRSYVDDFIYAEESYINNELSKEDFLNYKYSFDKFSKLTRDTESNYDLIIILGEPCEGAAKERRGKRDRFTEKDLEHFVRFDKRYSSEEFEKHCLKYVSNVKRVVASNPLDASTEILEIISQQLN